ncbi:MAG: glucokinase [Vicinamibacterales bacterium]
MILAGDVGGTKTLIGLFNFAPRRPVAVDVKTFHTADFPGLPAIITEFLKQRGGPARIEAACFGVAGPVIDQQAVLTNVHWATSATEICTQFKLQRVRLLNDLEAMAHAIPVLERDELLALQKGQRRPGGNAALIAAGTGLGEAILPNIGGKLRPIASEAGHADFAARTDREIELVRFLRGGTGRVDVEQVLSGPGLMNVYRFTHGGQACDAVGALETLPDAPAVVSKSALERWCPKCEEALEMFVQAYGAEAGNLALRAVASAGVYVGGGIAPRILPALQRGGFQRAFVAKPPMAELLEAIPVQVILNPQAALLGAAVYANEMI